MLVSLNLARNVFIETASGRLFWVMVVQRRRPPSSLLSSLRLSKSSPGFSLLHLIHAIQHGPTPALRRPGGLA